jgi:hypothetical protein
MSDVLEVYDISTEAIEVITQGPQGPPGTGGGGGGSGTVTSVALAGTGLSITGSPVTTSGTITANVAYGTTAGTATEGNDARIATIGSGAINTATGVIQTQPETLEVYSLGRSGLADLKVHSVQLVDDQNLGYVGSLSMANDLTADRGYYMPNATGTVALTQQATDMEITDSTKGYILNSATKRWRLTIDDNGVLLRTALALIFSLSFMCGSHAQVRDLVYGTNNVVIGPTNTNALTFTNRVTVPIASGAVASNSLLTADGSGGSSFVASRLSVAGLTTNVVRTSWTNVGADKPTNDTGLSLNYAANNVYKLRWQLLVGSTWSNFAYGLSFSSTNTYLARVIHTTLNNSQPTGITLAIGNTNYTLATETSSAATIIVWGETVWMPTNAGTVNMRFWTSSSNSNTSTLFSNSVITLEKLYP